MKYRILWLTLCLFGGLDVSAQYSFSKIGSVLNAKNDGPGSLSTSAVFDGVDHAGGILQVSIPIYEVKGRSLSMPLNLTYSATGIKPNNAGGIVGLGWSLNIGGSWTSSGASGSYSLPIDEAALQGGSDYELKKAQEALDNITISIPSIDAVNFPGGGGQFFTSDNGNYISAPFNPLLSLGNSTLIDGHGTRYYYDLVGSRETWKWTFYRKDHDFINNRDTLKFVDSIDNRPSGGVWRLKYMISADQKDTIQIKYDQNNFVHRSAADTMYSEAAAVSMICKFNGIDPTSPFECDNRYIVQEPNLTKAGSGASRDEQFPSRILFAGGRVELSSRWGMLDTLKVFSNAGVRLTKVIFTYDTLTKFRTAWDLTRDDRYILAKVDYYDSKDSLVNNYSFSYYQDLPFPADFQSRALDYWGFYNGATTNRTLLTYPPYLVGSQKYGIVMNLLSPEKKISNTMVSNGQSTVRRCRQFSWQSGDRFLLLPVWERLNQLRVQLGPGIFTLMACMNIGPRELTAVSIRLPAADSGSRRYNTGHLMTKW
ncbi:hypothetical protein SAMN05660909_01182 [Chitinophaga terrae (ex Kim and Jung 2007)]|uniref:Uncharacterized protein n=1 Tax=Chitinophaga terrae (ex Kim and Jung 2007) TaxID=408074 RepID=A0A1H3ZE10_9BACT|nr:hypothetical protein [Chitinophaga terrae (ex Kim and Jung 2007)]SEA22009.1 hypothetical protein SAMN05660909_01182 [Chitinophaga terrae (ex Kim and Jung 2007)]